MTKKIDDKTKDEKLQDSINREAGKYQLYNEVKLINMNILQVKKITIYQSRIMEKAKFTCSLLGNTFEKQIKTIEEQGKNKLKLQKF